MIGDNMQQRILVGAEMPQALTLLLENRSSRTESERRRLLVSCDEGSVDKLGYC